MLGGSFGINVKSGVLESLKVSVAWKSLLNGSVTIEIDGVTFKVDCEGTENAVWYDAMTESIYENALQWDGSIDLENLNEELEEIMTEVDSSDMSTHDDYDYDVQYFKGILEKLLTNLKITAKNVKILLFVNDDISVEGSIDSVSLKDITEDVKSREHLDIAPNGLILLSKNMIIGAISVNIKHENQLWKLIECTEVDLIPAMTGELNIYKSGYCEVLIKTGNLSAFLAPDYIQATNSILSAFSERKIDAKNNGSGAFKSSVGFIKVSIENMSLVLSQSPLFYDSSSNDAVYEINFEACELIALPLAEASRSITFSALKYTLEEDGIILSESTMEPALQVCVDGKGMQIFIKDKLDLKADEGVWSLFRSFMDFNLKRDRNQNLNQLPFSLYCPQLKLEISGSLVDRTDSVITLVSNLIFSGNNKSNSISFESCELVSGLTKISVGGTTISKSNFEIDEGTLDVSPFDPMHISIEGDQFVNVLAFDKACNLQDRIQLSTKVHNLISSRAVTVETVDADIIWLKFLFQKFAGIRTNSELIAKRSSSKLICGSLKLNVLLCDVSYSVSVSEIIYFMASLPDQYSQISDLRADLDYITRNGEVLGKKILTLSLDGSTKSLVLTEERKDDKKPLISAQISGIEFIIPVSTDLSGELKFIDELVGSDAHAVQENSYELHFEGHFSLNKCSVTPNFPSSWPRCPKSTVYSRSLRAIVKSKENLKTYQQDAILFVSKRSTDLEIGGIYEDGITFWQEKGYAPICEINFLSVNLEKMESYLQMTMENQDVMVELCEDSAAVAKSYLNYIGSIPRYMAIDIERRTKTKTIEKETETGSDADVKDLLEDVDDMMFMGALDNKDEELPLVEKFSQLDIEENFFKPSVKENQFDEEIVEGDFACVQPSSDWEALIELPINQKANDETLVVRSNDSVLVFGTSNSPQDAVHVKLDKQELEIDEDYFSRPIVSKDSFPFSREPYDLLHLIVYSKSDRFKGTFRIKFVDFTIKSRLVDGFKFSSHKRKNSMMECSSAASFSSSPLDATSPLSRYNPSEFCFSPGKQKSPTSVSASFAKWSTISGTRPTGSNAKQDAIEIIFDRINCEVDWGSLNLEDENCTDKGLMDLRLVIRKVEILDQVKASRWKTILTRRQEEEEETPIEDAFGNMIGDGMVRCELSAVQVAGPDEKMRIEDRVEYRLKVRVLPMRIHLDQDALKFASKFFSSFEDDLIVEEPDQVQVEPLFFQHCDIAEIKIRLDYKPKKIDFCKVALGKYAELLNLFQLEDAELSLPAVRLRGVKGAQHFMADLVRSWLPFIKNKQIPKMLNGIGPVRTVINLGSGVSDLILLPMHHYQKDGRLIRGLRKGTASFLHSTLLEGAKLGSKLAVGTQVILEQVDDIFEGSNESVGVDESKFAQQPEDIREGLISAYQSLATNLTDAMQTIVAVPIQVYEKSGPSGAIKAVIRAVPIAVLKPMIGATEAVGKTLMGIENTMDPSRGIEINQKYKRQNHK